MKICPVGVSGHKQMCWNWFVKAPDKYSSKQDDLNQLKIEMVQLAK
jgi:hypothetical protein